jgi:hypothetical protein
MPNESSAMDFVHDKLMDGTRFRPVGTSNGKTVPAALNALAAGRGYSKTITVDDGGDLRWREVNP